ncbi:hypothetical protein WDH52_19580 [Streptomyces sp. TRM70308]|uniref:hypothetical protein n=1 Tax=Streptomyces TaxID=1883 RepID=UPI002249377A|nr:hypothetical protein [Streptomyces sp. JHD 1]MCX2970107.1 hypothetical protein [Streptomyces sp. JHD 1]
MESDPAPTMTTYVDGQPVAVPATIAAVRAQLGAGDRERFDAEIERTPALQVPAVLIAWALPPEVRAADEEAFQRLARGDHSGMHPGADAA